MSDKSKLLTFHLDCQEEYHYTLKHFNILFYGYGCKQSILEKLFPLTKIINCIHNTPELVLQEIQDYATKHYMTNKLVKSKSFFDDLDEYLEKKQKYMKIILINFDFSLFELKYRKRIQIIGTYEKLNTFIEPKDINDYNFILRDLTTFKMYNTEIKGYGTKTTDKILQASNVLNSVSKKVRNIFLYTIETYLNQKTVVFGDLMQTVGKKFLYRKISEVNNHLGEFYDHDKIKRRDDNSFEFQISTRDKIALIEKYKMQETQK